MFAREELIHRFSRTSPVQGDLSVSDVSTVNDFLKKFIYNNSYLEVTFICSGDFLDGIELARGWEIQFGG